MSALIGAIFLLIVDNTSKLIFSFEIPIGIVTAIIGIPDFYICFKKCKKRFLMKLIEAKNISFSYKNNQVLKMLVLN